ncbi:MAG: ferric reductase-like transmembrane domain-containing protein [Tepidiformaceae bacterium]
MNIPWYLARSAGLVAYLLLFATVVLGLSIRTRGLDRYIARWRVTDIHIFLSLMVLALVVLHAGVLLWDGFVGYSIADVLVPFSTHYRTFWTGIGIVTLYALVLTILSFPARRYIGYRAWRTLHYGTFAVYVAALLHGIYAGTDSRVAWAQFIYIATAGTVLALLVYRVAAWAHRATASAEKRAAAAKAPAWGGGDARERRAAATREWFATQEAAFQRRTVETRALRVSLGAVGLTALVFIAAGLGPFRWGRGGVSDAAFGDGSAANLAPAGIPAAATGAFNDTYSGTASETAQSATETLFSLKATASGDQPLAFDIELMLAAGAQGRNTATSNSIILTSGAATVCSGQLQQLSQFGFAATCQGSGPLNGQKLQLSGTFDGGLGAEVTGSLQARPG